MNATFSRSLRRICALAFSAGLLWPAAAVAVTITPITGTPVTISADTAGAGWTTVTGPIVAEQNSKECSPGNIVISAPSGFEFNTAATVTATTAILNGNGTPFSLGPVSITSSSITVPVNHSDTAGSKAQLTFSGIQVRPTQGSPLASGILTTTGTTAFTSATPNNYGTLTEVPGALDHFAISPISSPQNAGTPITGITLTAQDVHNNTATNFSSTVTYGGTAGITGTSAAFTLGQLTGVSVIPTTAGTGMTFTVSASGKTGTATFNVNPAGLDHFAISPISSPQTAGIAITGITLTAQDVFNNTFTSFGSTVIYSGTAGITSTSAAFVSGQLSGVSVTPMVSGASKTFTVTASGKSGTATFDVNKPTPSINGVTASQSISYGSVSVTLSGTVSAPGPFYPANGETVSVTINGVTHNATVSGGVGGFSLSYATATIPASATPYTITYAYAGDAALNAAPNNTSTALTVNKATPTITTPPTASPITYGQTLASSTLSGGAASVAGGFAFSAPSTAPNAGTYSASVTFTPTDTANYNTATTSVNVSVGKATPTITTPPTASPITYGQTLASSTLSGGVASTAGTFAFTTPSTAPSAGTYSAAVTFTPTDTANYNTATTSVNVSVGKASPTITTLPTASPITYGQTLASSTLSGGVASTAGTFAFTAPSTAPSAGTYSASVTFTPTDTANYNAASTSVNVSVGKATPTVTTPPTASPITYGQTLASSTLSGGTASVAGTFTFTTPSTVPNAGTYSAPVTFTPTDTANYNTAATSANVSVAKATPTITTPPTASPIAVGQTLASSTLSGGVASTPGTFAFTTPSTAPSAGTYSAPVTFTPTDTANYNTATTSVNVSVGKVTPTITTPPTASPITYGQTLASSTLSGGVASVPGTFAFTTPSIGPNAGTYTASVTFTPTDTANYNTTTTSVNVSVGKATPTVTTPPAASPITYGQTLASSTLSGGSASVAGSFSFTTSATAPNAGTYSAPVTFTPTDTANYNTATTSASVSVGKATPTITTPPAASPITYGQTLAASTLSGGVASTPGTFAFTAPSTAPSAGTYSAAVTFTPTDTANYNTASTSVNVSVSKATPTITTPPTASPITYGQTLASSTLSGGVASVPGTFVFTTPSTAPNAGTYTASVTFTPTDTANYNPAVGSVSVAVAKATPTVTTWPTATGITYGEALSASTLNGGIASVPGSFAYTAPSTTPNAGTYSASVTFTPTDAANYDAVVGPVNVAVAKATPTITTWPTAIGITYGQALSASSLSGGVASVGGSFAFTAPSTTPNAGAYSASVTFTPTDTANYNPVVGSVNVAVAKATPNVTTWPSASGIAYGQTLSASALIGGAASVSGAFGFTTPSATPPSVGTYSASVTFTPTNAANYNTVVGSVNVAVANAAPSITTWPTATGITYGQALSASSLGGGVASVPGSFVFTTPSTTPNAGTYSASATFTPTDTVNYSSVVGSVNVAVAKATPTVTTWPTATAITYGETLASSSLSGGTASVAGSFAFATPSTTPNAGTYSASVTFTPTDAANYNTTSGTVSVTVSAGITGSMQLYGYLGPTEIVVTFVAKDSNGNVVGQAEQTLPAPGGTVTYAIGVPSNTKTLSVKPRFYLRKRFDVSSQITGQNQVAIDLGSFTGGDVNEDNQVDTTDYAWLRTCWGTSGPQYEINGPPTADPKNFPDLNGDGTVDSLDYEILRNGWYQAGDPQ